MGARIDIPEKTLLEMKGDHENGLTFFYLGYKYGCSWMTILNRFKGRGWQTRSHVLKKRNCIVYNGIRYFERRRGYYRCNCKARRGYLHTAVYIDAHGPIPDGCVVRPDPGFGGTIDPSKLTVVKRGTKHFYTDKAGK